MATPGTRITRQNGKSPFQRQECPGRFSPREAISTSTTCRRIQNIQKTAWVHSFNMLQLWPNACMIRPVLTTPWTHDASSETGSFSAPPLSRDDLWALAAPSAVSVRKKSRVQVCARPRRSSTKEQKQWSAWCNFQRCSETPRFHSLGKLPA